MRKSSRPECFSSLCPREIEDARVVSACEEPDELFIGSPPDPVKDAPVFLSEVRRAFEEHGLAARAVILREFLELRQRGGALILEQLEDLRVQAAIATGVAIEVFEIDRAFRSRHGLMMRASR